MTHITKTATSPQTHRLPSLFYRSAREGMQDVLAQPAVLPNPGAGVLLPAFIGWSPREEGRTEPQLEAMRELADHHGALPVRIRGGDRDHIYHVMNADVYGMVSPYNSLIEPVREDFAEMVALSKSVINFPVHQDLGPIHIPGMMQAFQSAL